MNIKIIIKSNNLYCRLTSGRHTDICKKLGISIENQYWDSKNQKIKNSYKFDNRDKINAKLYSLKSKLTDKFNFDNINGELIDGQWLELSINQFFNRTTSSASKNGKIEPHKIYFLDFCKNYLKNESINQNLIGHYNVFVNMHLTNFLKDKKLIKIKDITNKTIDEFVEYMFQNKYSTQSIKRHVNRFKYFLNRADFLNLETNKSYKNPIIVKTKEEDSVKEIYLNEKEIEEIYKLDYSKKEHLDNVRDNFVIGLYTGLRVSDFNNNLKQENIIDGFIEIKTKKTGTSVAIPLHKYIIEILNKRNGNLPNKISNVQFNLSIKEVCKDAGINEITPGLLFDANTKRNKIGNYEKYKLVSSHICRRSFATNLFGKVPNHVIQAVGGWATEQMMLHYIKKSSREQGEELKKYWDKQLK